MTELREGMLAVKSFERTCRKLKEYGWEYCGEYSSLSRSNMYHGIRFCNVLYPPMSSDRPCVNIVYRCRYKVCSMYIEGSTNLRSAERVYYQLVPTELKLFMKLFKYLPKRARRIINYKY